MEVCRGLVQLLVALRLTCPKVRLSYAAICLVAVLLAPLARVAAADKIDYTKQIKPILAARCVACHGAIKQEGGLRLDTAALAIHGGDGGAAIKPGDAAASQLVQRVTATDEARRMPQEGEPLKPEQIALLRTWIDENARGPSDEQPEQDPRDHWAFRPVVRPEVPKLARANWPLNPLDAFVGQQHERFGLVPQSEAPRALLVRRLYLDLIGLPPSADELSRIDADQTDGWYERLVKQLLDDPRHGERWARHWMDIWRYSDWWGLGDQLRNSQQHVWHWRDWMVESLNADTPYDEMIRLMLAADELHPNDLNRLRATGYLARNYFLFNRNQWMDETVEHVSKSFVGLTMNCAKCHDHKYDPVAQTDYYRLRAFFEPYHVRLDMVPGEADLARDAIPRVFDGLLDAPTYRFIRGQEGQPDKSAVIGPGVPAILAFKDLVIQPVSLPAEAWQPERRAWVVAAHLAAAQQGIAAAEKAVGAAREKLAAAKKVESELVSLREPGSSPAAAPGTPESAKEAVAVAEIELRIAELGLATAQAELRSLQSRAEALRASRPVSGAAQQVAEQQNDASIKAEQTAAAEAVRAERLVAVAKARQALAGIELRLRRAAADKRAPIEKELNTARETLEKAETSAAADVLPTDRATPLVGAKWTPTRFFSSGADDPTVKFQPQSSGRRRALADWITDSRNPLTARVAVNHLWARHMGTPLVATVFDFGRKGSPPTHPELLDWLASELVEHGWSMKHLHRLIVTSTTYRMSSSAAGREANVAKDADNLHWWRRSATRLESQVVRDSILSLAGTLDLTRGGPPVPPAQQADSTRRSLYFFHSNNERNLFLTTFDDAMVKECYRREQSVVPQQALALTNSRLVLESSSRIAARIAETTSIEPTAAGDATFVRQAFTMLLGITANEAEMAASLKALETWRKLPDNSAQNARAQFIWALLNHNDFVTLR